jgi:hypothetical protein
MTRFYIHDREVQDFLRPARQSCGSTTRAMRKLIYAACLKRT